MIITPKFFDHVRYYQENRESLLAKRKGWYATPTGFFSQIMANTKQKCKKRSVAFAIDTEWCLGQLGRQANTCALTGINFNFTFKDVETDLNPYLPHVQMLNPALGYRPDNCVLILVALATPLENFSKPIIDDILKSYTDKLNSQAHPEFKQIPSK